MPAPIRLSIVIPAFNEEKCIEDCIRHIRDACTAAGAPRVVAEIVVTDNNSSDRTAELAREAGAAVVFEPRNQIARARNRGAAAATGDWLLFIDADSTLSPELLRDTLDAMSDPLVGGGGAPLRFSPGTPWTYRFGCAAWNRASRLMRWAAGSYVFCRAELFRQVGGFDERLYASEEIDLSRRLRRAAKKRGQRFVILGRHPLLTSGRKADLYSYGTVARTMLRAVLSPRRALRNRNNCDFWYDGRR